MPTDRFEEIPDKTEVFVIEGDHMNETLGEYLVATESLGSGGSASFPPGSLDSKSEEATQKRGQAVQMQELPRLRLFERS